MHSDPTLHALPTLDGSLNTWEAGSQKERDLPSRWGAFLRRREGPHSFLGHSSASQLRPETVQSDSSPWLLPDGARQSLVLTAMDNFDFFLSLSAPQRVPWLSAVFLWCPRSGPVKMFFEQGNERNCFLQTTVLEVGLSEGLLCPSPPPVPGLPHPPSFTPEVPRCPAVLHSWFSVVISVLQAWGIWAWNSAVRYMPLSAHYQFPDLLCKQFWSSLSYVITFPPTSHNISV